MRTGYLAVLSLALTPLANHIASASNLTPGDLIVSETRDASFSGRILDIDPITGQQQVIGSAIQPNGLCLDAAGNIVIADFGFSSSTSAILRISPSTLASSVVTSGGSLAFPTSVSLDTSGNLLVAQQGLNGSVLRVNPITGAQTVLTQNLGVIEDAVLGPDLFILADSFQAPAAVYRIDPITGAHTIVSSGGFFNFGPHGICINKQKPNSLLVTEGDVDTPTTSSLLEINTITGVQTKLASGGNILGPSDVTQDASGITYVTDHGDINHPRGLVLRVDLQTGQQTVISSGGNLLTPLGIMVLPEPGLALIAMSGISCLARRRPSISRI